MANPVAQVIGKVVTTIGSAALAKRGARKAQEAQAKAISAASGPSEFERQAYERELARLEPFRQAALQATNRLAALYGAGGEFAAAPTREQLLADPLYGAGLDESVRALERSAAARGGLLSGRTIRGVRSETLQGLQNAFARNLADRQAQTNALAQIAQLRGEGPAIPRGFGPTNVGSPMADYYMQEAGMLQNLLGRGIDYLGYRSGQPKPRASGTGPYGGSAVPWRSKYGVFGGEGPSQFRTPPFVPPQGPYGGP